MSLPDEKGSSSSWREQDPLLERPSHPRLRKAVRRGLLWFRWTLMAIIAGWTLSTYGHDLLRRPEHVDPLDPAFLAQCDALLTPRSGTYTHRLARLSETLTAADNAVWIAEPGTSAEYFLGGFSSRDWWLSERPLLLVITPSSPNVTILTARFEQDRAEMVHLPKEVQARTTYVPWLESESPYEVLARHLSLGSDDMTSGTAVLDGQVRSFIGSGLKGVGLQEASSQDVTSVMELRERKDEREIGLLRCANQMTLHAIKKTRAKMHIGITESQTHKILLDEMAKTGLVDGDGLVLFGENAALPHGEGSRQKLKKEHMILIDAGGKWGDYTADVTRTFGIAASRIPRAHLEVWETVRQAQYEAYKSLTSEPAPHFAQLDAAARGIISDFTHSGHHSRRSNESGHMPDYSVFTTRLGHGVGLDGHESPYVNQGPQGARKVKPGHVFSIEPGVYLPEDTPLDVRGLRGVGVRLEDCFVVTSNGNRLDGEWLTGPVSRWGEL